MNETGHNIAITILGSGTCVPSLDRAASSLFIAIGEVKLLIDIGPGTMRRLLEAGFSIYDIDYLFITHFHPDHTGELASFLFAMKCMDPGFLKKPLVLAGGPGFMLFYEKLKALYPQWIDLPDLLEIREFTGGNMDQPELETNNFKLFCTGVEHRPESLAFRVETPDGVCVVVSGDTDYSEKLVRLAEKTDLLICESAFPDEFKVEGHMTPSIAGRLATKAGSRNLVLTHFYPECDQEDIYGQCRETWSGPLMLAADLLKINVTKSL